MIKTPTLLKIDHVTKVYGARTILSEISIEVPSFSVVCLTGSNGAGKTTLLDIICGLIRCDSGKIAFKGVDITFARPWQIAHAGVARTFQETRPFRSLTALENLIVAIPKTAADSFGGVFFRPRLTYRETRRARRVAGEHLSRFVSEDVGVIYPDGLSFGQRKLLEIVRAICTCPELILLDEPSSALSVDNKKKLAEIIMSLRKKKSTVLLVEHDINFIVEVSDYIYELDAGKVIFSGQAEAYRNFVASSRE